MIQNQLIDYINSQVKLGISRDAIKSTLVTTGWSAADVEDTLKSLDATKSSAAVQTVGATPSSGAAGSEPQIIKVSDLVSASPTVMPSSPATSPINMISNTALKDSSKSPLTGPSQKTAASAGPTMMQLGKPAMNSFGNEFPPKVRSSRGPLITEIVLGVLFLAAAGFAGFLFFQNQGLNSQLSSFNDQSQQVNAKLTALENQTDSSTTALTAQVTSLTGEAQELQTELSFYAPPLVGAPGATTTALITGTVMIGKSGGYVITAAYGAKVYVLNSKSAGVIAALAPLVSTSTENQFAGTYIPGSDGFTLNSVNGANVNAPPATTTATSSTPVASSSTSAQ